MADLKELFNTKIEGITSSLYGDDVDYDTLDTSTRMDIAEQAAQELQGQVNELVETARGTIRYSMMEEYDYRRDK